METKEIDTKVIDFTRKYFEFDLGSDGFSIERYVDYSDKLESRTIEKILDSSCPWETYDVVLGELDAWSDPWDCQGEFFRELKEFCKSSELDYIHAQHVIIENFYWVYPEKYMNPIVDVDLWLSCGDMNYDYTFHNQLSYAKDMYGYSSELDKKAGLYFIAKSQGKLIALKDAIKKVYKGKISYRDIDDDFIRTSVMELENLTGTIAPIHVIVQMKLTDAIELKSILNSIPEDFQYYPLKVEGTPYGTVTVPKTAICGLGGYDASSLMGIELEKDIKIPVQFISNLCSAEWYYKMCVRPDADIFAHVDLKTA